MRPQTLLPIIAAAGLLFAPAVGAAEKPGKPLNIKPALSGQSSDNWRDRAMRARAEFEPGVPQGGRAQALNERGDRASDERDEVGAGGLGKDRGEGGREE